MRRLLITCRFLALVAAAIVAFRFGDELVDACPFCSVASQTLSEETQSADAVVLARLVEEASSSGPLGDEPTDEANSGMAKFQIIEVLRGDAVGKSGDKINVVYFGPSDRDQIFMITGIGPDKIDWITPLPLSAAAVEYARKLSGVPTSGADRLAFFQDYLEHEDPLLAQDAYDEFARAPYGDVHELKPRMQHDRIVKWISDPGVSPSRRRLYFTMLGVCGSDADLPMLEKLIVSNYAAKQPFVEQLVHTGLSLGGPIGLPAWAELVKQDERRKKLGLDALVACYLTLRGGEGLDLIDEQFLKNPAAEYTYIYSTVMALRFHGDEATSVVPRERLLESMRLLLDNADFADQVPIDLSRWKDWSVLDRLVNMYKASDKNGYIRQPVVSYLSVASEELDDVGTRARTALAELERLDPEGVQQARSLAAFGALARARPDSSNVGAGADLVSGSNGSLAAPAATDATQGFAASAADVQATEEAADIPEPTDFEKTQSEVKTTAEVQPETTIDAVGTADREANQPETVIEANDATNSAAKQVESPPAAADEPVASPASAAGPNEKNAEIVAAKFQRPLVIGLPLAAAVVLMGVYWAILRYGAV